MRARCLGRPPLAIIALLVLLGPGPVAHAGGTGELEVTAMDGWTAVAGATVIVKDANGKEVTRGTTARNGDKPPRIEFESINAGTYTVEVEYTDANGVKKTGTARNVTVTAGGETKQAINVEPESGSAAGLFFPTSTQAALIGHDVFHGGIEGSSSVLAQTGYAVASDSPEHCRHGDGNATPISSDLLSPGGGPRILETDRTDGEQLGIDLGIPGVLLNPPGKDRPREGDDPRDTPDDDEPEQEAPPAFYSQVKMKCSDGGTGQVLGNRRMKLLDPNLLQPQLALEDQLKRDVGADADPLQCTTNGKGECTIHDVPVRGPAGKEPVGVDITSAEVVSFNALVSTGQIATLRKIFGPLVTDQIRIGRQTMYLSFSGSPGDANQIRKGARGAGIALQENKCRKEKPGPPAESLGSFEAPPSAAVPSVRLRLGAREGAR